MKKLARKINRDVILKNMPVGISLTTLSGEVLTANKFLREWLGDDGSKTADQVYVRPGDRAAWIQILKKDRRLVNQIVELKKKDGQTGKFVVNARLLQYNKTDLILSVVSELNSTNQPSDNSANAEIDNIDALISTLLERLGKNKKEVEDNVLASMEQTIMPLITTLENTALDLKQRLLLKNLRTNLAAIASPFASNTNDSRPRLTPMEIQVANLIRSGARELVGRHIAEPVAKGVNWTLILAAGTGIFLLGGSRSRVK